MFLIIWFEFILFFFFNEDWLFGAKVDRDRDGENEREEKRFISSATLLETNWIPLVRKWTIYKRGGIKNSGSSRAIVSENI